MPKKLLLAELPDALPDRGVLMLQAYPGWSDPSDTVRGEFLKNLVVVYANRHAHLVHEDYYDHPWQTLAQDKALLKRVGDALQKIRDAGQHGAVLIRIRIQGIDNGAWRHQEMEQHLVQLLTARGAVVSLLGVLDATRARSLLYRPSPDGEPSMVQRRFDLQPYINVRAAVAAEQ
jgi:hypothetical protein